MSLLEVLEPLQSWSREGVPAGLATLVKAQRSAPRQPGARFAVNEAGELAGSISSGCIEGDLHEHLRQILTGGPTRLLSYGITNEMAAEVGLACGGEIEVFAERYVAEDPTWPALRRAIDHGRPAILLTGISGRLEGRRLLAVEGDEPVGTLGSPGRDSRLLERAGPLLESGSSDLIEVADAGAAVVFVEPVLPPPRLAIVGASPVAVSLCHLAAHMGFEVFVIDPRRAFLSAAAFPEAARILDSWPDEGLQEVGLDRFASVVVLAHDRKLDLPALEVALRAGCRFIGQIGGRRTQRLRREGLADLGIEKSDIARVRGPVGLDIGSDTPEEIALAILAEIVAVQHGKA